MREDSEGRGRRREGEGERERKREVKKGIREKINKASTTFKKSESNLLL